MAQNVSFFKTFWPATKRHGAKVVIIILLLAETEASVTLQSADHLLVCDLLPLGFKENASLINPIMHLIKKNFYGCEQPVYLLVTSLLSHRDTIADHVVLTSNKSDKEFLIDIFLLSLYCCSFCFLFNLVFHFLVNFVAWTDSFFFFCGKYFLNVSNPYWL